MVLNACERAKTTLTREAREPEPPLALVVDQSWTASPFLLSTAGAGKHQPGYSRTSRKRKGAPARAPRAIEKERLLLPMKKPIANPRAKHSADGNPLLRVLRTQQMPGVPSPPENLHRRLLLRDSSLLLSQETSRETSLLLSQEIPRQRHSRHLIPRHHEDHYHTETRSPSAPSCSRSSSPQSDHRSSSPPDGSHASGSSVDPRTTLAVPRKPSARERCRRKSSRAESSCNCKKHRTKPINDRILHHRHATHYNKVDGDGNHHAMNFKDKDSPLDTSSAAPAPRDISVASTKDQQSINIVTLKTKNMLNSNTLSTGNLSQLTHLVGLQNEVPQFKCLQNEADQLIELQNEATRLKNLQNDNILSSKDVELSVESKGACIKVGTPLKNKSLLSSNTSSLSTGNTPTLNQLDDNTTCSTGVDLPDDVSLTDSSNSVEAFPVVVSAMEETIQTTDSEQPLTEQGSSRPTPISILTANTIGATRSHKILKVLFDPRSTYTSTKEQQRLSIATFNKKI